MINQLASNAPEEESEMDRYSFIHTHIMKDVPDSVSLPYISENKIDFDRRILGHISNAERVGTLVLRDIPHIYVCMCEFTYMYIVHDMYDPTRSR